MTKQIDKIQKIRAKNNKLWMDLMRLAFDHAPEQAKVIMNQISQNDEEITKAVKEMIDE